MGSCKRLRTYKCLCTLNGNDGAKRVCLWPSLNGLSLKRNVIKECVCRHILTTPPTLLLPPP